MWLFVLFVCVPLIEIALFIQAGSLIGLWPTLAIVVITAIIGTALVKAQGRAAIQSLRGSLSDLRDPTEPLAHGAFILVAGALLLTPGFFTDAVGFALLTPPIRAALMRWARKNVKVDRFEMGRGPSAPDEPTGPRRPGPRPDPQRSGGRPKQGDVIDGEYQEVSPEKRPTHSASGWTKH